jgi:hypothetical protein
MSRRRYVTNRDFEHGVLAVCLDFERPHGVDTIVLISNSHIKSKLSVLDLKKATGLPWPPTWSLVEPEHGWRETGDREEAETEPGHVGINW